MSSATLARGGKLGAICDRCRMSYTRDQLMRDPNSPGIRVCHDCRDEYNPYRLPPRQPDPIAIAWARPYVNLIAPIYQITPDVVLSPYQARVRPLTTTQDPGGYILAEGNNTPDPNEFPLPNEEYLPPRMRNS